MPLIFSLTSPSGCTTSPARAPTAANFSSPAATSRGGWPDFYRRFLRSNRPERHYVNASQVATVLLTIVSAIVTHYMDSIAGAWKLLIVTGAGTGTVLILRWYWWRINAWSEVSAMAAAFLVSVTLQTVFYLDSDNPVQFAHLILITVAITTLVWLATTFLTAPESDATLLGFYRKVRPSPAGWRRIQRLAPEVPVSNDLGWNLLDWLAGCALVYGALFGIGKIILDDVPAGLGPEPARMVLRDGISRAVPQNRGGRPRPPSAGNNQICATRRTFSLSFP